MYRWRNTKPIDRHLPNASIYPHKRTTTVCASIWFLILAVVRHCNWFACKFQEDPQLHLNISVVPVIFMETCFALESASGSWHFDVTHWVNVAATVARPIKDIIFVNQRRWTKQMCRVSYINESLIFVSFQLPTTQHTDTKQRSIAKFQGLKYLNWQRIGRNDNRELKERNCF